jgi:hypothetical protein
MRLWTILATVVLWTWVLVIAVSAVFIAITWAFAPHVSFAPQPDREVVLLLALGLAAPLVPLATELDFGGLTFKRDTLTSRARQALRGAEELKRDLNPFSPEMQRGADDSQKGTVH